MCLMGLLISFPVVDTPLQWVECTMFHAAYNSCMGGNRKKNPFNSFHFNAAGDHRTGVCILMHALLFIISNSTENHQRFRKRLLHTGRCLGSSFVLSTFNESQGKRRENLHVSFPVHAARSCQVHGAPRCII